MTFYHELKGTPLDAYNVGCKELLKRAVSQLGLPREELILRDLRPEDLGETGKFKFSVTSTAGWNTLIDTYPITDNRFVMINGMFTEEDNTPVIHSIRITRAGSVARWWNVQRVALQDDNEVFMDDPILVDQNQTITIEAYNALTTTNPAEEFGFIGAVVEKRGLVVNP